MSLAKEQQLEHFLKRSEHPLIILPESAGGDHVGAAWALARFLEAQDKPVAVAARDIAALQARYGFLATPQTCLSTLTGLRDFVISFSTKYSRILGVRTESDAEEYRIYVTPERAAIDPRDFSILPVKFRYDCLVVLGAPDKESLGALYAENPDIFYEVPVIDIDCHADNESFGQVNLVETTASSVSEVMTELLERLDPEGIDEATAECLLAGIMSATDSFQKKNATPKTLKIAARLMDRGADQQKLVRNLFKTQPLHLLRLWGFVMAGLDWDEPSRALVGTVTTQDLGSVQAAESDLPSVLEKIRSHYSQGELFFLLFDKGDHVRCFAKARHRDAIERIQALWPDATRQDDSLEFDFPAPDLAQAKRTLTETLREKLSTNDGD